MKKTRMNKWLILTFTLMLVFTQAALPFSFASGQEKMEYNGIDISNPVVLRIFAIVDAPLNQKLADEYFEVLNAYTKEKLNMTIEFRYASGNDYANNYQLALASGEKYDLIHAANWLDYTTHAGKGAFMPLDELLPTYAPYMWEQAKDKWDGVKINEIIYGIPTLRGDRVETAFLYREDLRKKYDVPEIKTFDDIEPYLAAIKENEPDLLPSDDSQAMVYGNSFLPLTKYQIVDNMGGRNSNFVIDPENPRQLLKTIELPEYKEYMHVMKDFFDKGYWPKDQLSRNDWGVYSVTNGKSAASFVGQFWNYAYLAPQTQQEHPGWELNFVPYCLMNEESVVAASDPTGAMFAVTRKADNPERALMFVDLAHQDETLWRLLNWGIEGVHYAMTDDKRDESILKDPATDKFNYFCGNLVDDPNFYRPLANQWEGQAALQEKIEAMVQPNILTGFVIDKSMIDVEYTTLNQVRMEYGYPLNVGAVEDVDAAYEQYVQQSKDAGLDICFEEIQKQLNEFLDKKGIE